MTLFKKSLIASALSASLYGCGGGGSNEAIFNGNVVDGYITGATVCLDENNNLKCDANEFSAVTQAAIPGETGFKGKDGWYTFTVTRAIVPGTQIVADIPADGTATDSDLGVITKPFKMLAPVDKPEVISPLTTLVSVQMKNSDSTDSAQAEKEVKVAMGLTEDTQILGKDFIADDDSDLTSIAVVTASVIKEVTKATEDQVAADKTDGKETLTDDQAVVAAIKQAASIVKSKKASGELDEAIEKVKVSIEAGATLNEDAIAKNVKDDAKIDVVTEISGNWEVIQAQTKSGDGSVVDLTALAKSGNLIIAEMDDSLIDADGYPSTFVRKKFQSGSDWVQGLQAEWVYFPQIEEGKKSNLVQGSDLFIQYLYVDDSVESARTGLTGWNLTVEDQHDLMNAGGNWVKQSERVGRVEGNCFILSLGDHDTEKACFVEKDFTGKTFKDLAPQICQDSATADCDAIVPEGSKVYDLTITVAENGVGGIYWDWGGSYSSEGTLSSFVTNYAFSDDDGFIGKSNWSSRGGCNVDFVVDQSSLKYDSQQNLVSGKFRWINLYDDKDNVGDSCSNNLGAEGYNLREAAFKDETVYEVTDFTVETVGGKKLIKTIAPILHRQRNANEDPYLAFYESSDFDDNGNEYKAVTGGGFAPSNFKQEIFFTGNIERTTFMSRNLFDWGLEQVDYAPFPYEEAKRIFKLD